MGDYMNYIDTESIAIADRAFEQGNYTLSALKYLQVLQLLSKYQGDRMQPIMMYGRLNKKYLRACRLRDSIK